MTSATSSPTAATFSTVLSDTIDPRSNDQITVIALSSTRPLSHTTTVRPSDTGNVVVHVGPRNEDRRVSASVSYVVQSPANRRNFPPPLPPDDGCNCILL